MIDGIPGVLLKAWLIGDDFRKLLAAYREDFKDQNREHYEIAIRQEGRCLNLYLRHLPSSNQSLIRSFD